nr:glycosyltransferase family 2 protein [Kocuria massiliensis]
MSIIIPHFGDSRPTLSLVDSILAGERESTKVEVIVVDDHSPVPLPALPKPCRVIRRPENGGFGAAVNTGLKVASCEVALVLNSDLTISRDFVRAFVHDAQRFGRAVVSPHVVNGQGRSQWAGRHRPTVRSQAVEWLALPGPIRRTRWWHEAVGHDTRCTAGAIRPVDWVMGACMAIPVEPVRKIGGFDEQFFMNCEEVDLQRRLHEIGVPSIFLGTHTVIHRGGGSSASDLRRQWLVASRFRYSRKWGGHRQLRLALTACTYLNFLINNFALICGRRERPLDKFREERALVSSDGTYSKAIKGVLRDEGEHS